MHTAVAHVEAGDLLPSTTTSDVLGSTTSSAAGFEGSTSARFWLLCFSAGL